MGVEEIRSMRGLLHGIIQETIYQLTPDTSPTPVVVTEVREEQDTKSASSPPFMHQKDLCGLSSLASASSRTHEAATSLHAHSLRRSALEVPITGSPVSAMEKRKKVENHTVAPVHPASQVLVTDLLLPSITGSDTVPTGLGNLDDLPACEWCGSKTWVRREDGLLICQCYLSLLEQVA